MVLRVDFPSEQAYARIIGGLRTVRVKARISQEALATVLPVRGRAVSEWETGAVEPTFHNLLLLGRALGQRLTLIDQGFVAPSLDRRCGESWLVYERRRLASPLRFRRQTRGLSQEDLGALVGVSRDTIQRWELGHVPPRPIAMVVWARSMGFSVALELVGPPDPQVRQSARCIPRPFSLPPP